MFRLLNESTKFTIIRQSEDSECLPESQDNESNKKPQSRESLSSFYLILLILTIYIASLALGIWVGRNFLVDADELCMKHISQPSPLPKMLPVSFHETKFNGSFLDETVFRRPASPQVDAAWKSLGVDYRSGIISQAEGLQAGLTETHVQIREKYGGGFVINVEGLHHLHCLNLLRQSLYYNFEYYASRGEGAFVNKEPILRLHVSHCLDILRQQLMCIVDIGVLGQVWWNKEAPTAFPDFNTKHMCRDFEGVRKWAFERQAPDNVPGDWLLPPMSLDDVLEELL